MKWQWLIALGAAGGLAVLVVCLLPVPGNQAVEATPFLALSRVPVPEMPAKAAELVQAAPVLDREATAAAVLQAVTTMARRGVMPYVVSAICQRNPEVTGTVVATAIQLQPDDELAFCRAAVLAAPDQVDQVVVSACAALPGSFANVAMVAFGCRPDAEALILDGLTNALPALMPFLDRARSLDSTNDFETVIRKTVRLVNDANKSKAAAKN
jgi:hypothetical protein